MTQRVIAEAREQIEEARRKAESNSYSKLSQQLELFMKAFLEIMDGHSPEGQALLGQYREAAREAEATLKEEVKEALDKAEKKANRKAQHIESLVRMLFLQKSERFILTDEERAPLLEAAANSVDLTAEEKAELNACNRESRNSASASGMPNCLGERRRAMVESRYRQPCQGSLSDMSIQTAITVTRMNTGWSIQAKAT